MATDRIINQTQGDEIIAGLLAIKNAITNQPVPTTVEDVVAPVFDDGVSYTVGEFVMHEGLLYKCTTAHHGAWNGSDFTLTTMGDQVSDLNNALSVIPDIGTCDLLIEANFTSSTEKTFDLTNYKGIYISAIPGDIYGLYIPKETIGAIYTRHWLPGFWQSASSNYSIGYYVKPNGIKLAFVVANGSVVTPSVTIPTKVFGIK